MGLEITFLESHELGQHSVGDDGGVGKAPVEELPDLDLGPAALDAGVDLFVSGHLDVLVDVADHPGIVSVNTNSILPLPPPQRIV